MIKQKNYVEAKRKAKVRESYLNPPEGCERIVGLAGPQILECIAFWRSKGFKHITIYEIDPNVFTQQQKLLEDAGEKDITHILGNIFDAYYMENVYYDVDLCSSINKVGDVSKFRENVMFTFCMRSNQKGQTRQYVEEKFFELRGEEVSARFPLMDGEDEVANAVEYITDKGIYHAVGYRDGAPMLVITKVA